MLNANLLNHADTTITRNAMVLTQQWDPRKVKSSQLQVDHNGEISVSDGALARDSIKPPGSSFFEPEKNILIFHLQLFIELITRRSQEIAGRQTLTPAEYYNQSNALQGLIHLLSMYIEKYKLLVKYLRKAENKVKHKKAYENLISADFQNLMLGTRIAELDELIRNVRETHQQVLTRNGQFNHEHEIDDTLDYPLFILGEGIEAFMPFDEPRISRFMRSPCANPLSNALKIRASFEGTLHHLTVCPSWQIAEPEAVIEGPCGYFSKIYSEHKAGTISYEPVMLSAMIDFSETDTTRTTKPFVQTLIEIALSHDFRQVVLHAPIGCSYMLYALGFRTKDNDIHPTLEEQEAYVVKADSTIFPIGYNIHEPMINIDCIDERFIRVTSLRVFYLDLRMLADAPVYLEDRNQPTTWAQLLENRRYLAPSIHSQILPEFNYLPYRQFTPSYKAICQREITGRMPLDRVRYESVVPDASDIYNEKSLQSIAAIQATLQGEDLEDVEKLVRSFHI